MDGISFAAALALRRPWPRAAAAALLVAGALPLAWPLAARSAHRERVLAERQAAAGEAEARWSEAKANLEAVEEAPTLGDIHALRPDRFNLVELHLVAREVEPPPYPDDVIDMARWCDRWDGDGRACERDGRTMTKAEAALVAAAHRSGFVPELVPQRIFVATDQESQARQALTAARAAVHAPVAPAPGAALRWAVTSAVFALFAFAARRAFLFNPRVDLAVDQHGVRFAGTHLPASQLLDCRVVGGTLAVETTEGALAWCPFASPREELERVAAQVRDIRLTAAQRADEHRAKEELERRHEVLMEQISGRDG